jgi:hypothetical protein
MAISYVEDYEEVTGQKREAEVEAKVIGAPVTEKPAAKTTASTKAK